MRLTWRDAVATAFTGAVVALYWSYLADVEIAYLTSVRAVAAVGLVLGIAGCALGAAAPGMQERKPSGYQWMAALGVVALIAALFAVITGFAWVLAVQIGATVLLWLITTARHAIAGRRWDSHVPVA